MRTPQKAVLIAVILIVALLAVMPTTKKAPKTSEMYASLRYDFVTDAVLWLNNKIQPFMYLYHWSGRTP